MNKKISDWENEAQEIVAKARERARKINRFVDLEDLALEEGRKLTQLLLQGIVSDKGDGSDIPLPEAMKNSKLKNKGLKKKD